ncbi:MAG TPA: nickel pincer cofactor biosynthesis protein LarC [Verrucomicrobiae bacterium]|nr:nickel pincer cofactor biosynthesis protein LarC [Verrucomicrobiae bacterium]
MKTLYLDIFSGISGDMFIAALIDLGVDAHQLEHEIAKLGVNGYHLRVARKEKSGIAGTKFDVHLESPANHGHSHAHPHPHPHPHAVPHVHPPAKPKRSGAKILNASFTKYNPVATSPAQPEHSHERNFTDICELISRSALSEWVKEKAIAVFHRIAVAEGQVHGKPPEQVHFHEVGAVDSIVDIVGACIALELLGRPRVLAAPVQEGSGWVNCAHGRFPLPTPATLGILGARGISVTQCEEPHELVTPTGAALLAEFAESFGPMQELVAEKVGFGLGTRDNQTRPNVLRAVLGETHRAEPETPDAEQPESPAPAPWVTETSPAASARLNPPAAIDWETDTIAVLETNLDDISGEWLGAFVERALAAGALDVFHTPIQMKKNRPAVLLTVLCAEADADRFSEMLLRETTAFGVRRTLAERRKLRRELIQAATPYGEITVKLGRLNEEIVQAAPEFESCRAAAAQAGVPLRMVYEAALQALSAGK